MLWTCHLHITDSDPTRPLTISLRTFLIRHTPPPSLIVPTDLLSPTTLTDHACGFSGVFPLHLLSFFDLGVCIPFLLTSSWDCLFTLRSVSVAMFCPSEVCTTQRCENVFNLDECVRIDWPCHLGYTFCRSLGLNRGPSDFPSHKWARLAATLPPPPTNSTTACCKLADDGGRVCKVGLSLLSRLCPLNAPLALGRTPVPSPTPDFPLPFDRRGESTIP